MPKSMFMSCSGATFVGLLMTHIKTWTKKKKGLGPVCASHKLALHFNHRAKNITHFQKKLISVWPAKNLIQYLWDELEHKTGPEATSVLVEGLEPEEWRLKQQDINADCFLSIEVGDVFRCHKYQLRHSHTFNFL